MWGSWKQSLMRFLVVSFAGGLMYCANEKQQSRSSPLLRTCFALLVCVLLSSCLPRQHLIPNPRIPHKVAEKTSVVIWVKRPDGQFVKETVVLDEGWWVASPFILE